MCSFLLEGWPMTVGRAIKVDVRLRLLVLANPEIHEHTPNPISAEVS